MTAELLTAAFLLLAATALWVFARFYARLDDSPLPRRCRSCGYDFSFMPAAQDFCPICGPRKKRRKR